MDKSGILESNKGRFGQIRAIKPTIQPNIGKSW